MANHKNFYETLKEARMRLQHTVVMYDGEPCYVLAIDDHKDDGIFRIYLDKLGQKGGLAHARGLNVPYDYGGAAMDEWLEKHPDEGIIRKMANSPLFNKYRPFPVGMVNCDLSGRVFYTRRSPTRHTQQGLTQGMLKVRAIDLLMKGGKNSVPHSAPSITSNAAYLCYTNQYPSLNEVISRLSDPSTQNNSAAFHREFAVLRGPLDMMFLAYKEDIVGFMPNGDTSKLALARGYGHCREVINELSAFSSIEDQK
jgi:hypothetical protein